MTTARLFLTCAMLTILAISGCSSPQPSQQRSPVSAAESAGVALQSDFSINYEKFVLDNGLQVILHKDTSDPVVAVALTVHVGSARENPERTGFAHLFEHLLFLESENLGKGGLDQMSARIGGSGANGSTSRDWTNYFQTVPKDALEKMIWAEADKLGWFINTVTEPVLAKEKQVVKNEKRLRVDNQPYGHNSYVIDKHLFPEDHPYHWQVIGSLEHLQAATLDDVKAFFAQWYVPNNATLSIAGDFDFAQAKQWVEKYFAEIPRGRDIQRLPKRPGKLQQNINLFHEDNFASLPQLTLVWPTVEAYHPDEYALAVLVEYLSQGKQAPLHKELIEEQEVTSDIAMISRHSEIAGQLYLSIRAFDGTALDDVADGVDEALKQFEKDGISQADLDRIKAGQETQFYQSLSSVLGKSISLARYNVLAGEPGYAEQAINNILNVSVADVMRVYETYIKGKYRIATSFVPKGQLSLALRGSLQASIAEENIASEAQDNFDLSEQVFYQPTPSSFDRSEEPPYGESYEVSTPPVWQYSGNNGLTYLGIKNEEVPLVEANLVIQGGALLDGDNKPGLAHLTANMLSLGTTNRTAAEFEAEVEQLGASIETFAGSDRTQIEVRSLARNYAKTMALVEEMLLYPRWDKTEFKLLKQRTINRLQQDASDPGEIARREFRKLLYPDDVRGNNPRGTEASIAAITLEDVKNFYAKHYAPSVTTILVVGDIEQRDVLASHQNLEQRWADKQVAIPTFTLPDAPESSQVYFYNVPGAKQSVLHIGYPALTIDNADFYPATVMNYKLGGGGFASRLTQELRENKGYTYNIYSFFTGSKHYGDFRVVSSVRTNATLESLRLIQQILGDYHSTLTKTDLETTQSYLIRSNARAFETATSKLSMLTNISRFAFPIDYAKQRQQLVREMSLTELSRLAKSYANPDQMFWLVVGDAQTQLPRLAAFSEVVPTLLNPDE